MKLNQTIDAEQLAEWIDLYQDQLFRYAFFRIGSKEDAEDVVQDAFLKIAATTAHIANVCIVGGQIIAGIGLQFLGRSSHYR